MLVKIFTVSKKKIPRKNEIEKWIRKIFILTYLKKKKIIEKRKTHLESNGRVRRNVKICTQFLRKWKKIPRWKSNDGTDRKANSYYEKEPANSKNTVYIVTMTIEITYCKIENTIIYIFPWGEKSMLPLFTCVLHFRSPNNHLFEYPQLISSLSLFLSPLLFPFPYASSLYDASNTRGRYTYIGSPGMPLLNFPHDRNFSQIWWFVWRLTSSCTYEFNVVWKFHQISLSKLIRLKVRRSWAWSTSIHVLNSYSRGDNQGLLGPN